jgi:hypothetical protein
VSLTASWRSFRARDSGDRSLITEAALLLPLVRLGTLVFPYPTLRRLLNRVAARKGAVDETSQGRVVWAVTAVARRLPWGTTCLFEALAAAAMLRRRGFDCELRFGVRMPTHASPFAAHAWIEHRGVVIVGRLENLRDFTPLSPQRVRDEPTDGLDPA